MQRLRGGGDGDFKMPDRSATDPSITEKRHPQKRVTLPTAPHKDANVPKKRYQIHQRCLYERTLPGNAFISAHANRLQHGYYESTNLHEDNMDSVYFVSVHFVFHPHDPRSHRFKSAEIQVAVHGENPAFPGENSWRDTADSHPRILKHAPELMFGAVSPENLQWNFSLSSSLGVSQAPVSATVNPTGGVKGSYKVFHMMSIQGSVRSMRSPFGPQHDVEDAMAVWTLEENLLQRSGLPREFDFVLLIHKPEDVKNVYLTVDVDAEIESFFGSYPKWYSNLAKFAPSQDFTLDFNADIGQKFVPSNPTRGFNFASLPHPLDEYVTMPGTVYPTNDVKGEDDDSDQRKQFRYTNMDDSKAIAASPISPTTPKSPKAQSSTTPPRPRPRKPSTSSPTPNQNMVSSNRHSWAPENLNVRVVLEHQYPQHSPDQRRFSGSPMSNYEPGRQPSIRRRKSRTGLKEYSAKQALAEIAQNVLEDENDGRRPSGKMNGHV